MLVIEPLCFLADLYTIEFQKKGLPHCHTLLWVSRACAISTPEQVDGYISAELRDPVVACHTPTDGGIIEAR